MVDLRCQPDFRFGKSARLLNKKDFSRVFQQCQYKVASGPILLLAKDNHLDHSRLGLVVRKKFLKKACQRNLMKRQARERFRTQQHRFKPVDIVLLNRFDSQHFSRKQLAASLAKAFAKLPKNEQQQAI